MDSKHLQIDLSSLIPLAEFVAENSARRNKIRGELLKGTLQLYLDTPDLRCTAYLRIGEPDTGWDGLSAVPERLESGLYLVRHSNSIEYRKFVSAVLAKDLAGLKDLTVHLLGAPIVGGCEYAEIKGAHIVSLDDFMVGRSGGDDALRSSEIGEPSGGVHDTLYVLAQALCPDKCPTRHRGLAEEVERQVSKAGLVLPVRPETLAKYFLKAIRK